MWLTGNMPQDDLKTSKKGDYLPKINMTMEKQPFEDSASSIQKKVILKFPLSCWFSGGVPIKP